MRQIGAILLSHIGTAMIELLDKAKAAHRWDARPFCCL
jgi:hypothetical protein